MSPTPAAAVTSGPGPVTYDGVEAARRASDLPADWFTHKHTDREVLAALFGSGWEAMHAMMLPGLATRFWFLERPGRVVVVALARDHEIEPYRAGETPAERRRWQRHHLRYWLTRASEHDDWADLMAAETTARLNRGHPVSARAARFFAHWVHRTVADPDRRASVLALAALAGYANAADLVRENTGTAL